MEVKRIDATNQAVSSHVPPTQSGTIAKAKIPGLPLFCDRNDDLDSYLSRFERYAAVARWERNVWATNLNGLLSGEALDVYTRLSQDDATDYEKLKLALLRRYNFTDHDYRQCFKEARPEGKESP